MDVWQEVGILCICSPFAHHDAKGRGCSACRPGTICSQSKQSYIKAGRVFLFSQDNARTGQASLMPPPELQTSMEWGSKINEGVDEFQKKYKEKCNVQRKKSQNIYFLTCNTVKMKKKDTIQWNWACFFIQIFFFPFLCVLIHGSSSEYSFI